MSENVRQQQKTNKQKKKKPDKNGRYIEKPFQNQSQKTQKVTEI